MKFTTRPLNTEDYEATLVGWWKAWGWDVPLRDFSTSKWGGWYYGNGW